MSQVTEERWVFSNALHVENPAVGKFHVNGLHAGIELNQNEQNWLVCSVPGPNVLEEWRIRSVMIQYNVKGQVGRIDKIGIRDGNQTAASFENLDLGPNAGWEIRKLQLPAPWDYRLGLGVTIHVACPMSTGGPPQPPTQFLFTSIGLEYIKSGTGPVVDPYP
jgi:hypothetical protein